MFRKFRRVMAFLLVISLSMMKEGVVVSHASSIEEMMDERIYVDGIAFKAFETNDGICIKAVEGEEYLTISENGEAQAYACDEDGQLKEYDLYIEDLSNSTVDVTISEDGEIIEEIDDIDELISDEYEGQVVIAITLATGVSVSTLLTAAAYATVVVVIGGVMCWAVDRVIDDVVDSKYYFKAYKRCNLIFINPNTITYSSAVSRVNHGNDVYTYFNGLARGVASGTGKGVVGPENHYKWYLATLGAKYYDHYHTRARNAHIFFGVPRNRAL